MMLGRYAMTVPILAIAGSMAAKRRVAPSLGTFPTTGPIWVGLLIGVIIIVGALTFFPALALGPIADQLLNNAGGSSDGPLNPWRRRAPRALMSVIDTARGSRRIAREDRQAGQSGAAGGSRNRGIFNPQLLRGGSFPRFANSIPAS